MGRFRSGEGDKSLPGQEKIRVGVEGGRGNSDTRPDRNDRDTHRVWELEMVAPREEGRGESGP